MKLKPLDVYRKLFSVPLFILGDGDFSFTKKLVMYGNRSIITSNLSLPETCKGAIKYLNKKQIPVVAQDATNMSVYPDRTVVWCFPYPINETCTPNELLKKFFSSSQANNVNNIILGLKSLPDDQGHQYNFWDLKSVHPGYTITERLQSPIFWTVTHVKGTRLPQKSGLVEFITFQLT